MRQRKIIVRKYSDRKRPHLKFVVNYREEGRRARKFFETKESATTFTDEQNIKLTNEGREGAEFPAALRVMAQESTAKLKPFGKTIRDAVEHYVEYLNACEKSCTAKQLVAQLVNAKEKLGASERHLSDLKCRLKAFADKFDGHQVATIKSAEIEDWLDSLTVSNVTRNHYLRLVVLAFNFAVKRGYAASNPAEKIDKAKERGGNIGILRVAEAAKLLENASPEVLAYVAIGLFAGLRRAEIERLDWSEIDFDTELIEVKAEKSKTAQRRFAKIEPNLREWLLPVRKHRGPVVPEENDFRKHFDAARETAGLSGERWPDNALRHSFASYHLAHFRNAATTALELGHYDSRITFRHYRELVKPKEAERFWNIKPAATEKVVHLPAQ